ncbi:aminoglycoside phosphotransferase family protein [Nocardioides sp. SR21]|uniref:aminoglycoside phosphotransferase family protein n=1 Tax=Nocardioides sp. SR21 TaxID=2919501 RepID=UPI001FAA9A0E|nr:aminoglycoside phosphotransferase family protein [Nocardioides sp. SR21]
MHDDDVPTTAEQVARMVAQQHPQWSHLPVTPVSEFGTDHCLFHVGDELVARMPRVGWAADQAASDAAWLPVLAPHLPVTVPAPVALGEPDDDYPFAWSVAPWLPGTTPTADNADPRALAADLGGFVRALHAVDATDGPRKTGTDRGSPIRGLDEYVRRAIEECGDRIDTAAVTAAWEDCVAAPDWAGDPVWIHGDLMPGNLLVRDGRLSAVIDWGALGTGDPAPDLAPAWYTIPSARRELREAVEYDDDTWRRARGWALGPALTGIPYYWDTVPAFAQRGQRTVAAVLADLDGQ